MIYIQFTYIYELLLFMNVLCRICIFIYEFKKQYDLRFIKTGKNHYRWRTIGDHKLFIGDPQMFFGDSKLFIGHSKHI